MKKNLPLVTIGIPVFNGGKTIERALKSVVLQSYTNVNILISNNYSNDNTKRICMEYKKQYNNIVIFNQSKKISMTENFLFLLSKVDHSTKYFCWVAADDYLSLDFIEENLKFLEQNKTYIASTSPSNYSGYEYNSYKMGDCSIKDESIVKRINQALCMVHSNARIFSLFKYNIFHDLKFVDKDFLGADFNIILHALKKGKLNKINKGFIVLSKSGTSHQENLFKLYAKNIFDYVLPFNKLLKNALFTFKDYNIFIKTYLIYKIFNFNILTNISRLKTKILYLIKKSHA